MDILFEEERGFWSAVYELIATTKRPIIMTCNGKPVVSGRGGGGEWWGEGGIVELAPFISLVPMLPRSGTRTLKLCRRGEPGIFCHVKSAKDRREVDATLIVRGRMRLRTEKGTKVADNLLHISSYRALNNIHTER